MNEKHLEDARIDRVYAMEQEAEQLHIELESERNFKDSDPQGYALFLLDYWDSIRLESEGREEARLRREEEREEARMRREAWTYEY